ncbi:Rossmann-like alpha/beta/alpha sandwich fold protein [Tanacetum coccineum]
MSDSMISITDTKTTKREYIVVEVEFLQGLNDDNDENRSEGYGSVRRRLVKKAERVDSFDVEAMAIVGSHGSLRVCIPEPFASGVTSLRSGRMQIETTQRSLLTRAMEDGQFDQIAQEWTNRLNLRGAMYQARIILSGSENSGGELNSDISQEMLKGETEADDRSGNKVMVVVDSNMESKGALHWAFDDTVQYQDTMILLHIATDSKLGERQPARLKNLYLKTIIRHDVSFFDKERNIGGVVSRMFGDTVPIQGLAMAISVFT